MSSSGPVSGSTHAAPIAGRPRSTPDRTRNIPPRRGRRSLLARIARAWPLYLALLPTLGLIAVFAYWPTINGIIQSFYNNTDTQANVFVGWGNYRQLFSDNVYWSAFENSVKYFVFGITVGWFLPFVTAELLVSLSNVRWQY